MSTTNPANFQEDLLKKIQSFDETYKSAYTHGLESIYTLETVNLASIRRVVEEKGSYSLELSRSVEKHVPQEQFDFGEKYRDWISSFLLLESIQVLEISPHLQSLLREHNFVTISDLIDCDFTELVHLPGLGQGHIDDIQDKLEKHVQGRSLHQSRQIDFGAWVRVLCSSLDSRKVFVTLEAYGLSDLIKLTASEKLDIHRLSIEMRQEWIDQTLQSLTHGDRKRTFMNGLQQICDALIKPWISGRCGIVLRWELAERVMRLAWDQNLVAGAMKFFSEVYFDGRFPLGEFLIEVDHDIYCSDELFAEMYRSVIEKVSTYFYQPEITYSLSHVVVLVSREFASDWKGFPEDFIEKAVRFCPKFRVRKAISGGLEVRKR